MGRGKLAAAFAEAITITLQGSSLTDDNLSAFATLTMMIMVQLKCSATLI